MCACSGSKQRSKREQREKNKSERVYRKEDKIEERTVIGINKKIDGMRILSKFLRGIVAPTLLSVSLLRY